MSNLDPRQQAIADGEAAWLRVSTDNWDETVWKTIGTALTLLRQEVLFDLGTNVARGNVYNVAFARRLDGTAFKTMDATVRSNLLFVMEPANRVVLDRVMAKWTPSERAKRTHPTTLVKAIRAALREPKPKPLATGPKTSADMQAELARERQRREAAEARVTELQREAKDGPEIDSDALYASLPKATQQRMEAWQRKRVQELAEKFEGAVHEKAYAWLNAHGLPEWQRYVNEAKKIYDKRKGIMDKETFKQIKAALNSASRKSITDKKLDEAFIAFTGLEKFVLDEKDSPTNAPPLPETIDKWERAVKTRPPKPVPGTQQRLD